MREHKSVITSTYRELRPPHLVRILIGSVAGWTFDPSFTEHDQQWNAVYQEQSSQQALRTRLLLNEIFAEDPSSFLSITAHSGTIFGFFTAVGHQHFGVDTGGFVPVIVRRLPSRESKSSVFFVDRRSDRSRR